MKKIIAAVLAAAMALTFSGCRQNTHENGMKSYKIKEMDTDFIQLKPPTEGDKIAIIDTDYGEIRVVLYEKYAPNTVANFIKHAENGDYDNIPVKGVGKGRYFLTGGWEDKKGNYVGRTNDDELVEDEYNVNLWPFMGALLGFSDQAGYSDARWVIVNNDEENLTEDAINELKDTVRDLEDDTEREKLLTLYDKFYEIGGLFDRAGENTVYGQTYLGLDVVKKLTTIPADEDGEATETVMIKSVTISEFKEGDKTDTYPREPLHPASDSGTSTESDTESSSESVSDDTSKGTEE